MPDCLSACLSLSRPAGRGPFRLNVTVDLVKPRETGLTRPRAARSDDPAAWVPELAAAIGVRGLRRCFGRLGSQ